MNHYLPLLNDNINKKLMDILDNQKEHRIRRPNRMRQNIWMVAVMAAAFVPQSLYAGEDCHAEIDGICYELTSDNEAYVISRSYTIGTFFPEDYDLVIPQTVEYDGKTYTVTRLKDFYDEWEGDRYWHYALENEPIASLSLPSTIVEIGHICRASPLSP